MLNSSLIFQGSKIYVVDPDVRGVYNKLRTAVLDSEIPVTMPIGFKLINPRNSAATNAIDRNGSCLESMIAISINVCKLVMTGEHNNLAESDWIEGEINTDNANFISMGKHDIQAVQRGHKLLTSTEPMAIRFYLNKAAGYQSMANNAEIIGTADFFPLSTMHSLYDFVNILPLNGNVIEVRYRNGMTPEIFEKLVKEA